MDGDRAVLILGTLPGMSPPEGQVAGVGSHIPVGFGPSQRAVVLSPPVAQAPHLDKC